MQLLSLVALTSAIAIHYAWAAETSLYLPDFDPQPISADVLGVGPDGETTFLIQAGQPTGIFSTFDPEQVFPATATLVEGPSNAFLSVSLQSDAVVISCAIANGIAQCNAVFDGETTQLVETVSPQPIQLGMAGTSIVLTSSFAGSTTSPSPSSISKDQTSNSETPSVGSPDPSSTQKSGNRRSTDCHWTVIAVIYSLALLILEGERYIV